MDLIIVESPTKAKTLTRFLGSGFHVESTMGHIRDLPQSQLGINVDKNFTPEYVLIDKKKDRIKDIQTLAKKAKRIYLATDPDREGEAIAYHVAFILKKDDCARIAFHEITEHAVKEALANPRKIDLHLVHAQQARRVLDRLVGYKLSPVLWKKVRSGLSAGRVQSVAVRLIVEKEREIKAFKPEEYWDIFVLLTPRKKGEDEFTTQLIEKNGKKITISDKSHADPIVKDLNTATYSVLNIDKKTISRAPHSPFTTSTLQQKAANLFGWSAKRTMQVAQSLYEHGFITYHRTDSVNIAAPAVAAVRKVISQKYGDKFLSPAPRLFKKKSKLAQEAHEAIRPTHLDRTEINPAGKFIIDAKKLYGLIYKRFLACQMADALLDLTQITVEAQKEKNKYALRTDGKVVKFPGWLTLYTSSNTEEILLPELQVNQDLILIKVDPQQKFTQPPARFTEASLIKTLEKLGIGRPSTYAPIITTIQDRQYVEKQESKFFATALGTVTNDFLVKNFDEVLDYQFTAQMEDQLDDIAKGEKKWAPVIEDFYKPFAKQIASAEKNADRVHIPTEDTGKSCPKCKKGDQVIRVGRFGKFISCSRFPDCDFTAPYLEEIKMSCPGCKKGKVVIKKTRKGKTFFGCSRYPDCKWASWHKPSSPEDQVKKPQK